jgi:hypothetical protein
MRTRVFALTVALGAVATSAAFVNASHGATPSASPDLTQAQITQANTVVKVRTGTGKYATNLDQAKADGYRILTKMIPDMGVHYINPNVTGFDPARPPILVYEPTPAGMQLGAVEWTFPSVPKTDPIPGATYGSFGAACHYTDGSFVFADAQKLCKMKSPLTGAPFLLWHPRLITMHVWAWWDNPTGLFSSTNPLVHPLNHAGP